VHLKVGDQPTEYGITSLEMVTLKLEHIMLLDVATVIQFIKEERFKISKCT
jgi:hypothetical protein